MTARKGRDMQRKGFTILELLVASLLLGMLVTILTMIFNQSSIAWRTGMAGVADLSVVRENIAEVREEADNAYIWNDELHRILGVWDDEGNLRERAWDVGNEQGGNAANASFLMAKGGSFSSRKLQDFKAVNVNAINSSGSAKTYTVNVKSAGPDREFNTYDDIWSYPDEFD